MRTEGAATVNEMCEAGGVVWLSTLTATRDADMAGQAGEILTLASDLLGTKGLELGDAVRTVDYVLNAARAEYGGTAGVRAERFAGSYPVSTGVFMEGPSGGGRPFALNVIAQRGAAKGAQRGDPGTTTFSPVVRHGGLVWLAGFVGRAAADTGSAYPESLAEQTYNTHCRIDEGLRAVGGSMADVVKIVDYVVPSQLDNYRAVAEQRRKDFGGRLPAATVAVVERLIRSKAYIEVEALAVLPQNGRLLASGTGGPGGAPFIVRRGPWVFTSGIEGAGDGPDEQAASCYRHLRMALKRFAPGARLAQVSHYCNAGAALSLEEYGALLGNAVPGSAPALTVALTPRQLSGGARLTIDAIAYAGADGDSV